MAKSSNRSGDAATQLEGGLITQSSCDENRPDFGHAARLKDFLPPIDDSSGAHIVLVARDKKSTRALAS